MNTFSLKKWYVDVTDASGNVCIGYWIHVQWNILSLYGYQLLYRSSTKKHHTWGGVSKQQEPFINQNTITWNTHECSAQWESTDASIHEKLFEDETGSIVWNCTKPKAHAFCSLPNIHIQGFGYTEYLEVTVPIWKLPFHTLYWGRALSDNHYVIWIQWEGKTNYQILFHNEKKYNSFALTDQQLTVDNVDLQTGLKQNIRDGTITKTILKPFTALTHLFPNKTFAVQEHKWYSLGTIKTDTAQETAHIIAEKVTW